jgi:hypothetical protein
MFKTALMQYGYEALRLLENFDLRMKVVLLKRMLAL